MATLSVTCSLGTIAGTVSVEAEENTARIASVVIYSSAAATSFKGLAVTISYGGTIFTGKVNSATANTDMDQVTLQCSDMLQNALEAKTEAELLTLIPAGRYSDQVFGDREDGWQQALDILSTCPYSVYLNGSGALTVAAWSASPHSVPDHVLGTASEETQGLRDMTNKVVLSAQVRYTRRHHREHIFAWAWESGDFCSWYQSPYSLPGREMVQSAAEGAVWKVLNNLISFTALPDTGVYPCGYWSISDELQDQLVYSAGWTAVRRWAQPVTENYEITVQSSGSIAAYGEQLKEDGVSYHEEYEDNAWDQDAGTTTPTGGNWRVDEIGDYVSDEITRADADAVLECKIAQAATTILKAGRGDAVVYVIPCNGGLELGSGVMQFTHSIDPIAGRAITTVRASKDGAGSLPTIEAPAPQDTSPTHEAQSSSTSLPTRINRGDSVPEYDEDWVGYTGNEGTSFSSGAGGCTQCGSGWSSAVGDCVYPTLAACKAANPSNASRSATSTWPTPAYPDRFRVVTQDIEDVARDEVSLEPDESGVSVSL